MPIRLLLNGPKGRILFWAPREKDLKNPYSRCPKLATEDDQDKVIRFGRYYVKNGEFPNNREKFKKLQDEDELHEIKGHQVRLIGYFEKKDFIIIYCDIKKQHAFEDRVIRAARVNMNKCKKELGHAV